MSGTTVTLDAREFTAALRRYADFRKMDNALACNREANQVAYWAYNYTQIASAPEVGNQLGQIATRIISVHGGKNLKRPVRILAANSYAYNIVAKSIWRHGEPMPRSVEINQRAVKLVNRRIANIGFIRRGWVPALRRLGEIVHGAVRTEQGRGGKGYARVAVPGMRSFAEIVNQAVVAYAKKKPGSAKALTTIGLAALEKAVAKVTSDMNDWVNKQLAEAKIRAGLN